MTIDRDLRAEGAWKVKEEAKGVISKRKKVKFFSRRCFVLVNKYNPNIKSGSSNK